LRSYLEDQEKYIIVREDIGKIKEITHILFLSVFIQKMQKNIISQICVKKIK
jgi:hypothetical protein